MSRDPDRRQAHANVAKRADLVAVSIAPAHPVVQDVRIVHDVRIGRLDRDVTPSLPQALALAIRLAVQRLAQAGPEDPTMRIMDHPEEAA